MLIFRGVCRDCAIYFSIAVNTLPKINIAPARRLGPPKGLVFQVRTVSFIYKCGRVFFWEFYMKVFGYSFFFSAYVLLEDQDSN